MSSDWNGYASGFAELFGKGLAMVEGDSVEPVESDEIKGEGGGCEGEEDGDHEPGTAEDG